MLIFAVVTLILVLISFKYPQVSLALFLMAGLLKSLLMFKFGFFRVVDITVLCAILLLVAMVYSFVKSGGRLKDIISLPLGLYLLLAVLLLLGTQYTSAPNYGLQKSSRFATLGLIAFLAPIFFAHNTREIKLMIWILFIVGIVFCMGTIIAPQAAVLLQVSETRARFLETNALSTAVQIGVASIIAFIFAIMVHTPKSLRMASLALIPVMIAAMIITGSRGPFLGMVFTWLIAFFVCRKGTSKAWGPVITTIILIAMIVLFIRLPEAFTTRISNMWKGTYEAERAGRTRTELFSWVIPRISERPILGHGTGAYAVDRGGLDIAAYPHNIILELLYEVGLVGAAIGSLFLWLIFRRWKQAAKFIHLHELDIGTFQIVHIAGLLFLFTLLQAMKSSDIDGNRIMFFCAGLVVATFSAVRRIVEEIPLEDEIIRGDWQELEEPEFQDAQALY